MSQPSVMEVLVGYAKFVTDFNLLIRTIDPNDTENATRQINELENSILWIYDLDGADPGDIEGMKTAFNDLRECVLKMKADREAGEDQLT